MGSTVNEETVVTTPSSTTDEQSEKKTETKTSAVETKVAGKINPTVSTPEVSAVEIASASETVTNGTNGLEVTQPLAPSTTTTTNTSDVVTNGEHGTQITNDVDSGVTKNEQPVESTIVEEKLVEAPTKQPEVEKSASVSDELHEQITKSVPFYPQQREELVVSTEEQIAVQPESTAVEPILIETNVEKVSESEVATNNNVEVIASLPEVAAVQLSEPEVVNNGNIEVVASQPEVAAINSEQETVTVVANQPEIAVEPKSTELKIPEYVEKAINDIATSQAFANISLALSRGCKLGDGFVGEIIKVTVSGTQNHSDDSKLVLIVKLPPDSKIRREALGMKLFKREVFIYNHVLPVFAKFQQDKGLKPGVKGFYSYPKCYFAHYDEERDESALIMEDIRDSGFKMENKNLPVQYSNAKTVMEKLAQLHGISLAMKDQQPEEFAKFKELRDVMSENQTMNKDLMEKMIKSSVEKAVATLGENEQKLKDKIIRVSDIAITEWERYFGENSEPYSVVNHGDCWINNMMFKYEVN